MDAATASTGNVSDDPLAISCHSTGGISENVTNHMSFDLDTSSKGASKAAEPEQEVVFVKEKEEKLPEFPRPRFVLTIIAPDLVTLPPSMVHDEWEQFSEKAKKDAAAAGPTSVHVDLLLVSMVNRLIREHTIPREAIYFATDPTSGTSTVKMLLPAVLLPDIINHCERLGVGNMVGMVYASPLETFNMPEAWSSNPDNQLIPAPIVRKARADDLFSRASTRPDDLDSLQPLPPRDKAIPRTVAVAATAVGAATTAATVAANVGTTVTVETNAPGEKPPLPQPPMPSQEYVRRHKSNPEDDTWTGNPAICDDKEEKKDEGKKPMKKLLKKASFGVDKKSEPRINSDERDNKSEKKADPEEEIKKVNKLAQKVIEARKEWLATASRVRVEQVAEEVNAAASLSWDYTLFVVCAAIIAALGLMTNSSVTTLASMLISPIMGPVMGFTFGTMIRRKALVIMGLRNELLSLSICLFVGFICGILGSWWQAYEHLDWPSPEMLSRGDATGLVTGVMVALPSGVATALSTLNKNSSGLVGVAISLSLLPPAVNAGVCWAYAMMLHTDQVGRNSGDDTDYVQNGVISFALTVINIFCIWVAGSFTFWMKEVAPIKKTDAFWSRDVKVALQQQNKNLGKDGAAVQTLNSGIQAAMDLKKQEKHVNFPDQPPPKIPPIQSLGRPSRRYSESHLTSLDADSRMSELVRARDLLFDDALLKDSSYKSLSEIGEDAPALPEDFRVDQRTFINRILGGHLYS